MPNADDIMCDAGCGGDDSNHKTAFNQGLGRDESTSWPLNPIEESMERETAQVGKIEDPISIFWAFSPSLRMCVCVCCKIQL